MSAHFLLLLRLCTSKFWKLKKTRKKMDFAKKQLEKYGWKEGQGLGRNEDGISEALKPKLKFDNAGVGHSIGEQYTNNWWERVFNSAAKNINVQSSQEEVKLERLQEDAVEISTKNYSLKELKKNKHLHMGSFLKTEKLTESGVQNYNVTVPEPLASFTALTDEELFQACGGRTAHKGARHGLKLSGKLSRIEKQEKILLKKMKNVSLTDEYVNTAEKKLKKIKKHKDVESCPLQESGTSSGSSKNKKNKKKRKSVSFNEEAVVKYYTPDADSNAGSSNRDENSNDSVVLDPNANVCDEGIEQDLEDTNSEIGDNSHRSFEQLQTHINDLSKAERNKLKKKRKLEKKKYRATEQFIEEVRQELAADTSSATGDDKCKKRKFVNSQQQRGQEQVSVEKLNKYSKKKKYVPEAGVSQRKKDKKMNSIVEQLDNKCKISDNE